MGTYLSSTHLWLVQQKYTIKKTIQIVFIASVHSTLAKKIKANSKAMTQTVHLIYRPVVLTLTCMLIWAVLPQFTCTSKGMKRLFTTSRYLTAVFVGPIFSDVCIPRSQQLLRGSTVFSYLIELIARCHAITPFISLNENTATLADIAVIRTTEGFNQHSCMRTVNKKRNGWWWLLQSIVDCCVCFLYYFIVIFCKNQTK